MQQLQNKDYPWHQEEETEKQRHTNKLHVEARRLYNSFIICEVYARLEHKAVSRLLAILSEIVLHGDSNAHAFGVGHQIADCIK